MSSIVKSLVRLNGWVSKCYSFSDLSQSETESALAPITYSWRKCPTLSDLLQSQSLVGEHVRTPVTYIIFSLISVMITRTKILNVASVIFSTFRICPYFVGQIMWTPCRLSGSDSQFTLKGIGARADSLFAFLGPILSNIYR